MIVFNSIAVILMLLAIVWMGYIYYRRERNRLHIENVVFGKLPHDQRFAKLIKSRDFKEHYLWCVRRFDSMRSVYYELNPHKKPKPRRVRKDVFGIPNGIARELPPHKVE